MCEGIAAVVPQACWKGLAANKQQSQLNVSLQRRPCRKITSKLSVVCANFVEGSVIKDGFEVG